MNHIYKPGAYVKIRSNMVPGKYFIGRIYGSRKLSSVEEPYYYGTITTSIPGTTSPTPGNQMLIREVRILGLADYETHN